MYKIVIIGAGPAGIMSAISSKIHNPNSKVVLIERNNQIGTNLRLTGGGRCNITCNLPNEAVIDSTPKNGKFLYSSLDNFSPKDIQAFFTKEGCPLVIEDHHRVFPASLKSSSIIDTLQRKLASLKIDIIYDTLITEINTKNKILKSLNQKILYDYLIIATGGVTYPHTGSDGIGYSLAKKIGHTITDLIPAEVPLVSNDKVIQDKTLQGLSFNDVRLDILQNNKVKKSITHDLIITHFGLSGPAALRASFYIQKILEKEAPAKINIDFLPNSSFSELSNYKGDDLESYLLNNKIPKRLLTYMKDQVSSDEELRSIVKKFNLTIYTTRGFNQAFVTNGGISVSEIDPKTMKSKIDDSISFCGEIIDINSFTGGFNITCALSTGYTAGKYILKHND